MTPHILHMVADWIEISHETYCRIDNSQRTDLKPDSLQRGGIR